MAHQSTGNVETPLERSVVEETTDVDASIPNSSLTSGETLETTNHASYAQTKVDLSLDDTSAQGDASGESADKAEGLISVTQNRPNNAEPAVAAKGRDERGGDNSSTAGSPIKPENDTAKSALSEGINKAAARLSAVKKPMLFKAVSINRHFLEKASSTGSISSPNKASFPSEKPLLMVQQTGSQHLLAASSAKPRLVTRSGGFGLRDSSPGAGGIRQSTANGQKKGAETQRTVWTKNQPPPVVSQKELSDEELKKTYGIHLASRLQSDEGGKEPKWADADDDDDDWIPETVEWSDGTKIQVTLQPCEEPPAASPPTMSSENESSTQKPLEPPSTIPTEENLSNVTKSIESSGTQEVAATMSARSSPWAPIPLPSQQQSPFNNIVNPPNTSESNNTTYQPFTKQVHADDFNRSWREKTPSSRELFNSETGQLEPVQDRRNRSGRFSRIDLQYKPPVVQTVLQRPASQLSSPAEPSPAFQQQRSSIYRSDDYRRRRASSNVSGGSGSTGRRLSFTKSVNQNQDQGIDTEYVASTYRPNSHLPPESVALNEVSSSTPISQDNSASIPPTPSLSASQPTPPTLPVVQNPVAIQQRIMKETIEAARRRKEEEAQAEKAEQQKRIKARLELLDKMEAEKRTAAAATAEADRKLSTPKPPSPEPSPEPSNQADKPSPQLKTHGQIHEASTVPNQVQTHVAATFNSQPPATVPPTSANQVPYRLPVKQYTQPASCEPRAEPWNPVPPSTERYTNWGSSATTDVSNQPKSQNSTGNPWGPVGDKPRYPVLDGIGNSSQDSSPFSLYGRSPITYRNNSHYVSTLNEHPSSLGELQGFGRMPSPVRRPPHLAPNFQRDRVPIQPTPPLREQQRAQALAQWNALPDKIQREESEEKERLFRQQQKAIEEAETRGFIARAPAGKITEKWRKGDDVPALDRPHAGVQEPVPETHFALEEIAVEQPQQQSHPPQRPLPPHLRQQAARQTSRFFSEPHSTNQAGPSQDSDCSFQTRPQLTASPPPGGKPVVHLPQIPSHRRKSNTEVTSPTFANGNHRLDNSTSRIEAVQMKIKALVHHPPEPRTQETPVASTTKPFLDDARMCESGSAMVTLPPNEGGGQEIHENDLGGITFFSVFEKQEPWTKPSEEELLAELYVQDFGSQPTVNIPINVHYDALEKPTAHNQTKPNRKNLKVKVETIPIIVQDLFPREGFITFRLPTSIQGRDIPFAQSHNSRPKNKWGRGKQNRVGSYRDYSYSGMRVTMHGASGRAMTDPVQ